MLHGSREQPRPGGGWIKIGPLERPNTRSHGKIRDSRLGREPSCGKMTIRSVVNGESRLKSRVHSIVQVRETLTPTQLERLVAAVKEPFAVPDGAKEKGE